ncbi:Uncharacterised protein [Vibrio cholerae]|nr:Uncharacterised protein [Vibrio cholerae]
MGLALHASLGRSRGDGQIALGGSYPSIRVPSPCLPLARLCAQNLPRACCWL